MHQNNIFINFFQKKYFFSNNKKVIIKALIYDPIKKVIVSKVSINHKESKKIFSNSVIVCISRAEKKIKDHRLSHLDIYLLNKPTLIEHSAIINSRIKNIYYFFKNNENFNNQINKKVEPIQLLTNQFKFEKINSNILVAKTHQKNIINSIIDESKKGEVKKEVPIAALIYDPIKKKIVAKAHNLTRKKKSIFSHAEILCIKKLEKKIYYHANELELYVTLEPCLLCYSAIYLSNVKKIYYLFDSDNSVKSIFDKKMQIFKITGYENEKTRVKNFFFNLRLQNKNESDFLLN